MIRQLHEADENPDYCECGRGPVVGLLTYTSSRVWFRTADEGTPAHDQGAADLRCLNCVTDAVTDVADASPGHTGHLPSASHTT